MSVTVTITGHLADTPELRFTSTGESVTNFHIISNERRFDEATNEWVDAYKTTIRVTAWDALAENLVGSLTVGTHVTVTGGRLSAAPYQHRETGAPMASLEMRADTVMVPLDKQTANVSKAVRPDTQQ